MRIYGVSVRVRRIVTMNIYLRDKSNNNCQYNYSFIITPLCKMGGETRRWGVSFSESGDHECKSWY